MDSGVLTRFIKLMALLTFVAFTFWMGWEYLSPDVSGDYYVREGDIRIGTKEYDKALESFNLALEEQPDHRGALMGRAIVFMQTNRPVEAEAELDYLITYLNKNLSSDDPTGQGTLAAAFANRGILHDRQGRYEKALEDYISALKVDPESVDGPGVIDKILHNVPKWSSVRERAEYLYKQLQLPEEERLLRVPELDDAQRMHKP